MFPRYLQRLPRAALILAMLTIPGFASGWGPDDPADVPLVAAIHVGNEPGVSSSGSWDGDGP